ncbi:TPA: hypothetical protein VZF90_002145 [Streptococcus pneumoniae]|nr:hypothetical protein [Streptococcus pneumoniae]
MVVVEPIRNRDDVQLMIEWLALHSAVKESDRQRNLMLFLSGVNLGFRIGDIVKLKVKHVKPKSFIPLSTRCNLQNP